MGSSDLTSAWLDRAQCVDSLRRVTSRSRWMASPGSTESVTGMERDVRSTLRDCPISGNGQIFVSPRVPRCASWAAVAQWSSAGSTTCVGKSMDATFLHGVLFPPPAPCPCIIPRLCRACAGSTANAGIALLIQPMDGHVVGVDIVPDLCRRPVTERIEFRQAAMFGVQLYLVDHGPAGALIPPQTSHPGF